jgi:predicted transcriptional regulator
MAIRRRARSSEARPSEQLLPEAEMEILAVLEARGEAEAREIRDALASYRPMRHASVLTLLGRLEAKSLVTRRKADVGKAYIYSTTRSTQPLLGRFVQRMVRRIFANDSASLVAALFESKPPTDAELRQIRALVDSMQKRGKKP